jgi:glycosyltransferase involved in cell wall biosynthesis
VRLLLIAFYFPPAGGGGVQRTLKFCRHLPEFGVDVDVLAPSDPKWFAVDEPLLAEIPAATTVHRTRFLGPRSSFRGDALRDAHGLRRAAVQARYAYERALIPDKAAPWAATAVPAAVRIVRNRRIDAVMTTSPPASVHLIGAAVAAATRRPWVADLRDSWLAHPHRRYDSRGVRAKRTVERRMARTVTRRASALVAVTGAIAAELGELDPGAAGKTHVIGHGVDLSDFAGLRYEPAGPFTIVHTGAFFGQRTPRPFLTAVRDLLARRPDLRGQVRVRFVGDLRASDRAWAQGLGIDGAWEETGFLPFRRAVAEQRSADALLLLIPYADGRGDTVVSGKVYEYLAARRPVLAAVPTGGAAAALVRSAGAGDVVASDDIAAQSRALEALVDRRRNGGLPDVELPAGLSESMSRRARAGELAAVLHEVAP